MVILGQDLSQLHQDANRQPASCELFHDDRKPRDETSHFRSPECRGVRKPQLTNAIIEGRRISELAVELPSREAGQLDNKLDYEMPLAPNQVCEAAVDITRGGRFHSNRLTRVSPPSCEGRRRPQAHDLAMGCFSPRGCAPAYGSARGPGPHAASLTASLRQREPGAQPASRKCST